ncbi:MAG: hypothetical protein V3T77_02050 [Planctomycetota bacterium]
MSEGEAQLLRARLEEAQQLEAEPQWREVAERIPVLVKGDSFTKALELLENFPARLRLGRFQVLYDERRGDLLHLRRERLASYQLGLATAVAEERPLAARQLYSTLLQEPAADQQWYKRKVFQEYRGFPWVAIAELHHNQYANARRQRRREIRTSLVRGVVPEPCIFPAMDLLQEQALDLLHRNPRLLKRPGSAAERLFTAGLLADLRPHGVVALADLLELPQDKSAPSPQQECEAARLFAQAQEACGRWAQAEAELHWQNLESPQFTGTVARRAISPLLGELRDDLRRGVFLRSGAFAAQVQGEWGEVPRFVYRFLSPAPFRDWRAQHLRWQRNSKGYTPRRGENSALLEWMVPCLGSLRLELVISPGPSPWTLRLGYGTHTVGIQVPSPGEVQVLAGREGELGPRFTAKEGMWPLAGQHLANKSARIVLIIEEGRWQLRLGELARNFELSPAGQPGWIRLQVPAGMTLGVVSLEAEPHPTWLDARQRRLQ